VSKIKGFISALVATAMISLSAAANAVDTFIAPELFGHWDLVFDKVGATGPNRKYLVTELTKTVPIVINTKQFDDENPEGPWWVNYTGALDGRDSYIDLNWSKNSAPNTVVLQLRQTEIRVGVTEVVCYLFKDANGDWQGAGIAKFTQADDNSVPIDGVYTASCRMKFVKAVKNPRSFGSSGKG
jgi:hypothetical protein